MKTIRAQIFCQVTCSKCTFIMERIGGTIQCKTRYCSGFGVEYVAPSVELVPVKKPAIITTEDPDEAQARIDEERSANCKHTETDCCMFCDPTSRDGDVG
jgi:hypothetical protein